MMRKLLDQVAFADLEFRRQGIELDPVLRQISTVLDLHPELVALVEGDLDRGLKNPATGRQGLGARQVLRSFVLWRIKDWPYRELRERIADGYTLRLFTGFGSHEVPKYQAFQRAFCRLQPDTVRALNDAVVVGAVMMKLEDGRALRVDTTVVETDIHYPTDSHLLWDCVRVLTRTVEHIADDLPDAVDSFPDRRRRAKRRYGEIARMKGRRGEHQRAFRRKYHDLLAVTGAVVAAARRVAVRALRAPPAGLLAAIRVEAAVTQLRHYADLAEQVIDQTRRRIVLGEQVSATEKIYSIFETHTDLLVRGKARQPAEFGHKVFLAESQKGLLTEYRVLEGNPVDSTHVGPSLDQHKKIFGAVPTLYAGDRGFDDPRARRLAEDAGVRVLGIPQRGGTLSAERAAIQKSPPFKKGQAFRCGIEGTISVLFRGRGMKRCLLEGPARFEVFVGASVLASNLLRIGALLERRAAKRAKGPPPLRHAA